MKKTIKYIAVRIAALGIIGCIVLFFPQMRQVIIGFGEQIVGRSLNNDFWDHRLLEGALFCFYFITAFLIICFSKFEFIQISPKKKEIILKSVEVSLICLYLCMLIFLSSVNNSIWVDEAYSLSFIQHSWTELTRLLIMDVHPPFYYFVLKAASLVFGSSIVVMKMVSIFPTILMVVFVSLFLQKEFSHKAVLVFLLSCIASQSITFYAIEIRMYTWALFFIMSMFVSAYYFFKSGKKRWWIAMLLCVLGAAYTHYWAAVAAAIGYLLLFFYALKRKKDTIIAMLLLAVFGITFYLPQLLILIEQFTRVSNNFWIEPLTIGTILGYIYAFFSTGNYFGDRFLRFMFVLVFISFFIRKNKTEGDLFFFGGVCCSVLLVLSGIVISIAIRPLFYVRYLIPVVGLIWMFFAVECSVINKKFTAFICVVLVPIGIMSFSLSAQREIRGGKEFDAFYTYFTERVQDDDAFIFIFPIDTDWLHIVGIIKYLFPKNIYTIIYPGSNTQLDELTYKLWGTAYTDYEDNKFNHRTVWIFVIDLNMQNGDNISQEIKGEFTGSFGWDGYRFDLFNRRSLSNIEPP
jgi:hypothetical protein